METRIYLNPKENEIEKAAECVRAGGLCVFPTETVFGLGANALDENAAKKIYEAKGRPSDNPLIVHLSEPVEAELYAYTTEDYYRLAKAFMPGPLTVIMKARDVIPKTVTGGLDTVAVRVPSYSVAHELIRKAGVPIAAPSANISGRPSPTRVEHVIEDMNGRADIILGGENCEVGVESTIITLCAQRPTVLRPGYITLGQLKTVCPDTVVSEAVLGKYEGQALSPGMRYKHYAPKAKVIILDGTQEAFYNAVPKSGDVGILCFDTDEKLKTLRNAKTYGAAKDSNMQAKMLFECLRSFDKDDTIKRIYARMPSDEGVGLAVLNRLIRAAGFNVRKV